jgi:hypothetical protein
MSKENPTIDYEGDREMERRIKEIRKKRDRNEHLTDKEWTILAYGSFQQCHCGG